MLWTSKSLLCTAKRFQLCFKGIVLLSEKKPSKQSSTYEGNKEKWGSHLAFDGITNKSACINDGCSQTQGELKSWIQVDLGILAIVKYVKIFNRLGAYSDRIKNARIYVARKEFQEPETDSKYLCASVDDDFETETFNCLAKMIGRYVQLKLETINFLHINEMQVFGLPCTKNPENINLC